MDLMNIKKLLIQIFFIDETKQLNFGETSLRVLFTPGHSPGHISLYSKENNSLISGDVIFKGSIGRTDLPGGNYETLINSIKKEIITLNNNTKVYSGHGPFTSIIEEKKYNPFIK